MKKSMILVVIIGVLFGLTYYWYNNLRVFELSFETNGGNETTSIVLKYNEPIPELEVPNKEGFTFAGWYTDSERTIPFLLDIMSAKDIRLYADWGTEGLVFVKVGMGYIVSNGTASASHIVIPKSHQGEPVHAVAYQGFQNQTIQSVTIPNTVTIIGESAFNQNFQLEQVVFEQDSQLHTIEDYAFRLSNIKAIVIPASVTYIGYQAFGSIGVLESVTFENGSMLKTIGEKAFMYSQELKSFVLPDAVESIEDLAFAYSGITEFTISSSSELKTIGQWAFMSNPINSIYLPSQLHSVGQSAFAATAITALHIPVNVEIIGDYAFAFSASAHEFTSIYVEAESKPDGWSSLWNYKQYDVVWNAGE